MGAASGKRGPEECLPAPERPLLQAREASEPAGRGDGGGVAPEPRGPAARAAAAAPGGRREGVGAEAAAADGLVSACVLGVTNCGKSAFVNALLRDQILPVKGTSSTSVLTHVKLCRDRQEPVMHVRGKLYAGKGAIRAELQRLNAEVRGAGEAEQELVETPISSAPCESLTRISSGSINLIDVPGHDEATNPIVKETFKLAARLCDVIIAVVPYTDISTDSTKAFLERLESEASHTLTPFAAPASAGAGADGGGGGGGGAGGGEDVRLVFLLSKCDLAAEQAAQDGNSDSSDAEGEEPFDSGAIILELKSKFRAFLQKQWGTRHPHAAAAPVFAISASNVRATRRGKERELFDWPLVESFLLGLHEQSAFLGQRRKILQARQIIDLAHAKLISDEYPTRALVTIAKHNEDREAERRARERQKIISLTLATLGVGLLAGGGVLGWVAVATAHASALAAAAATAAGTVTATTSSGAAIMGASAGVVSVAGIAVAAGAGAGLVGARAADGAIEANPEYNDVMSGEYEDTLAADGTIIYVGSFRGKKPHGRGRAFWPNGRESLIGTFENGRFSRGKVVDEGAVLVGTFLNDEVRGPVLDGWQPTQQATESPECVVCMEAPAMCQWKKGFRPCSHGSVCEGCAERILAAAAPACPMCMMEVSRVERFL